MPDPVAPGGSSTINGVIYQLLWSLLHFAKFRVSTPIAADDETPEFLTVVLEPLGGGGDVEARSSTSHVVEQIKARSDGGPWSLRAVIEDVFPDLFLATGIYDTGGVKFRFVTEGRIGAWDKVYRNFFGDLKNRPATEDPLVGLDDQVQLTFTRQASSTSPFFPEPCTERSLFLKIADVISERPSVRNLKLDNTELHRRLRFLLANFEFDGGLAVDEVRAAIDALLLAIVDNQDDIPQIRDHLAMAIARESTVGGRVIDAVEFLSQHGLDATPLTDWAAHIMAAEVLVGRTLQRNRYDRQADVRQNRLPELPGPDKVLVVTGESGTGKSWTLDGLADSANGPLLPILIESEGTAEATLQKCANVFWNEVHDGDEVLPLARVSRRLQKLVKVDSPGLTVLVDEVRTYEEARRLVAQDWSSWSSRLVITCPLKIARSLKNAYPTLVEVYECRDFTWEELHTYLERRLGPNWPNIPVDVRETLRTPLLAGIYCDELGVAGWEPTSEYELYQRVWERLSSGPQSEWPLDIGRVENLARDIRIDGNYPFSRSQLLAADINDDCLVRLLRTGWIASAGPDRYRFSHDRLLQWAVARSLCSDLRDNAISADDLVEFVAEQVGNKASQRQVFLGYIPMDVLWMLSQEADRRSDVSVAILEALENVHRHFSESLYDDLIPTLGECIADAVYDRFVASDGYPWILKRIAKCLAAVGAARMAEFAGALVKSDDWMKQRRGIALLRLVGCPDLLDEVWQIHMAGQDDPESFGEDKNKTWLLYEETFDALRKSIRERPEWILKAVDRVDPSQEPVHDLCWLVAGLDDDGKIWSDVKSRLFEKTPNEKPRGLVANISRYRDSSELDWLKQWIGSDVDHVASLALQALSRLEPDAAVLALRETPTFQLEGAKKWSFSEVFARRPAATHAVLLDWMKCSDGPWDIVFAFQGRENDISSDQLELLLDALCHALSARLADDGESKQGLHRELAFLAKLAAPEHLTILRERRETEFESMLRDFVLKIGPKIGRSPSDEGAPAIAVLSLIGGTGLTAVANEFLLSDDEHGKLDAIAWAGKRPDEETFDRLVSIVQSEEQWPGSGESSFPVNQNAAMKVLAEHGRWEQVIDGLKKWGMRTSPDLKGCAGPVAEPWVDGLRHEVELTPTPGNVIALGIVGSSQDCSLIHSLLDQCEDTSELAHACIIALEDLDDTSDEGVLRVSNHLAIENQRYSTVCMLTNAGTPSAWQTLFTDLQENFDFVTALNLINLSDHATETAEIVLSQITSDHGTDGHSLLKLFLTDIRPESVRERILSDSRVRELFHRACADAEGRFWCVGSKANAISCMAEFESHAAFAAACNALADEKSHDRERFPYILIDIDLEQGRKWLVDQYISERSELVRIAICRALEDTVELSTLLEGVRSTDPNIRRAFIDLSGWAKLDNEVDEMIDETLSDRSEVIRAAIGARHRRRDRRLAAELADLVVNETDAVRKQICFDAVVGFADPGDEHRSLPSALSKAFAAVSALETTKAFEKLKKRRKKAFDQLKKSHGN